ncbi:radical SAM protein [Marinitoga lauensis]|uniref:radical SAM protein n=1 Tax=Marinitoga lauensis TaxID=2201189 RepID=UPI001404BE90|nr:radical SAM protein [Marinitoga lauensis]
MNFYKNRITKIDEYQNLNTKNKRYGLFLCIANICNAKCIYCFANHGDYGKEKGIMPSEIAYKAIDKFMEMTPKDAEAYIIFFGGEPLLAFKEIINTVEYTNKKYLGEKSYQFHIVTNGTLLSRERIDFFMNIILVLQ